MPAHATKPDAPTGIPAEVRDRYEPGWRACETVGHACPGCGCACHWRTEDLA